MKRIHDIFCEHRNYRLERENEKYRLNKKSTELIFIALSLVPQSETICTLRLKPSSKKLFILASFAPPLKRQYNILKNVSEMQTKILVILYARSGVISEIKQASQITKI